MMKSKRPAADIDAYLAAVPEPARTALEKLRKTIRSAAPKATELISYRIPVLSYLGHLVGFGAAAKHCSFYVMSSTVLEPFQDELDGYDTSKGTIRFAPEAPLPVGLVKRIVKARIAENQARAVRKSV
jgi:uncharacterized protein YdhG (YjbR/CyaY superfamily)